MPADERVARVRDAVRELLPEVGSIRSLHRVDVGWGNENWTGDTEIGRVMVKVGLAGADPEKWRCAGVAIELARAAGVPAPEPLAFTDSSSRLEGRVLRIFSYLEGDHPRTIFDDASRRTRFLGQLGEAVARLHTVALPRFSSRIGSDSGFDRWSGYIGNRWTAVVARAVAAGVDRALVSRAADALLPLATQFDDLARPVLCHRDLYADNLLCDRHGNLVAVLDFDTAEAWEPAADFHKLRWWVFADDARSEAAFMAGYLAGGSLPDRFDDRTRLVEIIELVNGLANWLANDDTGITFAAEARLRTILG